MRFIFGLVSAIVLIGVTRFGHSQIPVDQRQHSIFASNLERSPRASAFDRDGNLVIAGHYSSFPGSMAFLYKVSPAGQLLWSKSLGSCEPYQFTLAIDQVSGDIFVSYYFFIRLLNLGGTQLVRLRSIDGETIWSKSIMTQSEVTIHQVGTVQIYQHEKYPEPSLKRLDPANGNEMWSRGYSFRELAITNQGAFLYDSINYNLTGIDSESGAERWTIQLPALAKTLPSPDGDIFALFHGSNDTRIAKISYESGQFNWNHQLFLMGSTVESRYDLEISDSSIVAGIGVRAFMGEWYKYVVSSRNLQNGNELGHSELNDRGTSRLIRSGPDTVFLQASPSKLVALSAESLAIRWTTEFEASETYLSDMHIEPPFRSVDPLIFVSNSRTDVGLTRFSKVDGQRMWQQQIQPQHHTVFWPNSAELTEQGIIVSGNATNFTMCLLLDNNLNFIKSVEGDPDHAYAGTFPNGDILFKGPRSLFRYSWAEEMYVWSAETSGTQEYYISPLGELFVLNTTGQYHTISKIDQSTGQSLFSIVTPELVSSLWPWSVKFGTDGNPILIAFLTTKINRFSGHIIFSKPIIEPSGMIREIADVSPDGSIYLGFVTPYNSPARQTMVRKLSALTGLQTWEQLISRQKSRALRLLGFSFDSDSRVFLKSRVQNSQFAETISINPGNGNVIWRNTDYQSSPNGDSGYNVLFLNNGRLITMTPSWNGNNNYSTRFVTIDKLTGVTIRTGKLRTNAFQPAIVSLNTDYFATFHLLNWLEQNSPIIATKFWSN